MQTTRNVGLFVTLAGIGLAAMAGTAQAATLTLGDSYYLGQVNDGIPSAPANEVAYISSLLKLASGAGATSCADAPSETCNRLSSTVSVDGAPAPVFVLKNESGKNSFTINSGSVKYIIAKYDAENAGSWVWYKSDGFTGSITLPGFDPVSNKFGISHYSLFNTGDGDLDFDAPEPGTLALLGLGLIGLGFTRRRQAA
jgi:hypothetical protein